MLTVTVNPGATPGNAMWRTSALIPVVAGQTYTYQDSYRSNVTSYLDERYYDASGTFVSEPTGTYANPSPLMDNITGIVPGNPMDAYDWQRLNIGFTVPAGASQVEIQRTTYTPGTLQTDLYSLTLGSPQPLPPTPVGTELVRNRGAETISGTTPVGWTPNSWSN